MNLRRDKNIIINHLIHNQTQRQQGHQTIPTVQIIRDQVLVLIVLDIHGQAQPQLDHQVAVAPHVHLIVVQIIQGQVQADPLVNQLEDNIIIAHNQLFCQF